MTRTHLRTFLALALTSLILCSGCDGQKAGDAAQQALNTANTAANAVNNPPTNAPPNVQLPPQDPVATNPTTPQQPGAAIGAGATEAPGTKVAAAPVKTPDPAKPVTPAPAAPVPPANLTPNQNPGPAPLPAEVVKAVADAGANQKALNRQMANAIGVCSNTLAKVNSTTYTQAHSLTGGWTVEKFRSIVALEKSWLVSANTAMQGTIAELQAKGANPAEVKRLLSALARQQQDWNERTRILVKNHLDFVNSLPK